MRGFLVVLALISAPYGAWAGRQEGKLEPIEEVFEPPQTFDPQTHGKVAVVQWAPGRAAPLDVSQAEVDAYKAENREALAVRIQQAAERGAELVITPEFGVVGYPDVPELPSEEDQFQSREQVAPYVETADGESFRYFSELAKRLEVAIHFGFAEVDARTEKYYNTVIALDRTGKRVATYRKIHLFKVETKFLSAGNKPVTYQGPFGKIGITICSDIYSGKPMENYHQAGVNAVALSTSWAQWNTGMDYFKAGARWTEAYVLAANHTYFPDSGVVNPDGTTQSHIRQSEGIAYGYLPYHPAR